MRNVMWVGGGITGIGRIPMLGTGARGLSYLIKEIFRNGEQGFFYDPNDLSTLFQDAAGTVPVTAVGQPVGLIHDKSGRNNHAYQNTSAARPILRQNAVTGANYLEFDIVDDYLQVDNAVLPSPLTTLFAVDKTEPARGVLLSAGAGDYITITSDGVGTGGSTHIARKVPKDVVSFRFVGGDLTMRTSAAEGTVKCVNTFATAATKYIGLFVSTGQFKFGGNIYGIIAIAKDMRIVEENNFRSVFNSRLGE